MKIGFVLNQFPELSQTFVLDQVLGLHARGHEVQVLAACPGQAFESGLAAHGYDVEEIKRITLWANMQESLAKRTVQGAMKGLAHISTHPGLVARAYDVRRYGWFAATGTLLTMAIPLLERPQKFDAIIAHFGPQGVIAAGLRELKLIEGPLLTYFHAFDLTSAPRTAGKNMYARLFEQGEKMLAISERGRELLLNLGARAEKIDVHHMGIDLSKFQPKIQPPSSNTHAQSQSGKQTTLRVLSVGRLCEKKGFLGALDAIAEVQRQGTSVHFTVIGTGPWRSKIEARIKELNLESIVTLRGAQSRAQVLEALHSHDVLLVPSLVAKNGDEEGIPMVIMEALACNVAVIATRNGGIEELIEHNRTGLLVQAGDAPGLAAALTRMSKEPQQMNTMKDEGARRIAAEFSLSKQLDRLEAILADVQKDNS